MYLILDNKGLWSSPDLNPEELKLISEGAMQAIRIVRGEPEYLAEVISRSIDEPTNSLDETRYDQAIEDRIYEAASWQPLPKYQREPAPPDQNRNSITVFADEEARRSLIDNESEDERRKRLQELNKE